MADNALYVSVATRAKIEAIEQRLDALEATVAQLSAQLGPTSFSWGNAQAYRDAASELPANHLFIVADTLENFEALAQEYDPPAVTSAYTIFAVTSD